VLFIPLLLRRNGLNNIILYVISWVLFAFCLFLGVFDFIDKDFVRGFLMLIACVIISPLTSRLVKKNIIPFGLKAVVVMLLVVVTCVKITM